MSKKAIKIQASEDGTPESALGDKYELTEQFVRWAPPTETPTGAGVYQNVHCSFVWTRDGHKYLLETGPGGWLLHELSSVTIVDDDNRRVK